MPFPIALVAVGIAMQAYAKWRAEQGEAGRARENARRAGMLADDALQRGEEKAGAIELVSSLRQDAQLAGYGHAGVDATSGTPLKTIATTGLMGGLEAAIARNNARRDAFGYEIEGASFDAAASRAENASVFNLFGSVFGGLGSIAGSSGGGSSGG